MTISNSTSVWWWIGGVLLVLVLLAGALWLLVRGGRREVDPPQAPQAFLIAFLAASLVALLGLSLGAAGPAVADQTAVSSATVTLQGGGLSISAPVDAGNLGTISHSVS